MPDRADSAAADEAAREEAAAWLARLRAPDGAEHHADFEGWYSASLRHAEAYDALLDNWERMALASRTPAARARARTGSPDGRPLLRRPVMAAAAAILLVIAGASLYGLGVFGAEVERTMVASRLGDIQTIELSDGTRVTLDTDSAIEAAYSTGERRVVLQRGRARFAVAHEADRAFVVEAGHGIVVARGTLFDVELRGRTAIISLLNGSVEVSRRSAGAARDRGRLLAPGQRLTIDGDSQPDAPTPLPTAETRWPSGMLSFDNARLADVVAAANRYGAARIMLPDAALRDRRFTGTFRARDTEGLARMLAETFDLDLSRGPNATLALTGQARPPQ